MKAATAHSWGEPEGAGRAALVQAVRPKHREECLALLAHAATTVQELTELIQAP